MGFFGSRMSKTRTPALPIETGAAAAGWASLTTTYLQATGHAPRCAAIYAGFVALALFAAPIAVQNDGATGAALLWTTALTVPAVALAVAAPRPHSLTTSQSTR